VLKLKKQIAKFDIKEILPIALVLVVAGIGIAYGINVESDIRNDFATTDCAALGNNYSYSEAANICVNGSTTTSPGTFHYNATMDSMEGVSTLAEKMPLIATIVVAAIVIGILVRYLFVRFG